MKITNAVISEIYSFMSGLKSESGGILGSSCGGTADTVIFDRGVSSDKVSYIPDTDFLNRALSEWANEGITFSGVFHSHVYDTGELSDYDKFYIEKIMSALPEGMNTLYFPVIIVPKRKILCYKARKGIKTEITTELIEVIRKG